MISRKSPMPTQPLEDHMPHEKNLLTSDKKNERPTQPTPHKKNKKIHQDKKNYPFLKQNLSRREYLAKATRRRQWFKRILGIPYKGNVKFLIV